MSRAAEFQTILSVLHTAQKCNVCKFVRTAGVLGGCIDNFPFEKCDAKGKEDTFGFS
jgi:hypothetical protein